MVIGIVVVTLIAFLVIDLLIRISLKKLEESRIIKERRKALDIGLKLNIADEARSLKRVHVKEPKARILAVDDEEIVLDSFRKILVLAGYSIDTVENGSEALMLVKKNNYDFVFTDLKMPQMDGIEVTKAVKHLRPDIDVIVITGYATIESAVETMKYGAMDYVQKPFTEDELVEFVNRSLIKRQDRIEREIKPSVHLITPTEKEDASMHKINVPAGVFFSPDHTWGSIEINGLVRIGIDDFAQKLIGKIDQIILPPIGQKIKMGEPLFSIKQESRKAAFLSPVTGEVKYVNTRLLDNVNLIKKRPFEHGWICYVEAANLKDELNNLKIGPDAASWYKNEIDKYTEMVKKVSSMQKDSASEAADEKSIDYYQMDDRLWDEFTRSFLHSH